MFLLIVRSTPTEIDVFIGQWHASVERRLLSNPHHPAVQ